VANYDQAKKDALLQNPGIIRNRLKINAAVNNAQQVLRLQKEHGSFSNYIWQFTDGKTKYNSWKNMSEIPGSSAESDAMSKALQKEGFKFVGTTICYAFMQATGMVHDHLVDCHCYRTESELSE
jgi:DNA-3-methyladenine glycosylase I